MFVKICGLTRERDIDAVNAARPDYVGFVFAKSKRQVSVSRALELKSKLDSGIAVVGVFKDARIDDVTSVVSQGIVSIAQLHGAEDDVYIEKLKEKLGIPIIKAISVFDNCMPDKDVLNKTLSGCLADYLLFDSAGGGTGIPIDWTRLSELNVSRPFFLAGGLNQRNISDAIATVRPFAVDTSSGVETNGLKDPLKIMEFVSLARLGCGI